MTKIFWPYHLSRTLHLVGLVVSVSSSQAVGQGFKPRRGYTKDIIKMVQTASLLGTHALM